MNDTDHIEDIIKTECMVEEYYPVSEPEYVRILEINLQNDMTLDTTDIIKQEQEDPLEELSGDDSVKLEATQLTTIKSEAEEPPKEIESVFLDEYSPSIYLYCDFCKQDYQDFCGGCSMLSHILNNKIELDTPDRAKKTIPSKFLKLKEGGGVVTLRDIPVGVTFGPHEGLLGFAAGGGCCFELDKGKLMCVEPWARSNWLQFLNYCTAYNCANLIMFQSNGGVYFRTKRVIAEGLELLAYYGKPIYQKYFQPMVLEKIKRPYSCVPCCLGFSIKVYLKEHWTTCPNSEISRLSFEDPDIVTDSPATLTPLPTFIQHPSLPETLVVTESMFQNAAQVPNSASVHLLVANQPQQIDFAKLVSEKAKDTPTPKRYWCQICQKDFVFLENLQEHAHTHSPLPSPANGTTKKKYKCRNALQKLMKQNHTAPTVKMTPAWRCKCNVCKESSETQMELDKNEHGPPPDLPKQKPPPSKPTFKCEKCDKSFDKRKNLRDHAQIHAKRKEPKAKLFKCNYCDHMSTRRCMDFVSHMLHKYDKSTEDETTSTSTS